MSWYAIRRKSTGKLLPAPPISQKGGQTHASFENEGKLPPRLFRTRAGANVCMKLWLRGDWTAKRSNAMTYDSFGFPISSKRGPGFHIQFENSRQHLETDIEVVEVNIQVILNPTRSIDLDDDLYP
jgi:hypothetical protein